MKRELICTAMLAAAVLPADILPAAAQAFLDQPCNITPITFDFARNQPYRTVQTLAGSGCTASFRGGLGASFESITVVRRAQNLTISPTSNGFGFTVAKRTRDYRGPDSYTLRICGQSGGSKGCATITYDVTVQ
jgi:hypothetical protein